MTGHRGETPPQPEKTVTLGSRNTIELVLRASPPTGTVSVFTPTEPRCYIGRITGLGSSRPRCELEVDHESMTECRRAELRSAALEFHYAQIGTPVLIRPVEQPPPKPPGQGSKRMAIAGSTIVLTSDPCRRSVSLYTGVEPPQPIGEVTGFDDGTGPKLFVTAVWISAFAKTEDCEEVKTAACDLLRAERIARRMR